MMPLMKWFTIETRRLLMDQALCRLKHVIQGRWSDQFAEQVVTFVREASLLVCLMEIHEHMRA